MRSRTTLGLIAIAVMASACSSTEPVAAALSFRQQPSNTSAGQPITPAVVVGFVDNDQGQVTSVDATITIALSGTGSQGATLTGTLTVTSVDGLATFADLRVDQAGAGFELLATAEGFPERASNPFNVQ